jgi:hypothetical protein
MITCPCVNPGVTGLLIFVRSSPASISPRLALTAWCARSSSFEVCSVEVSGFERTDWCSEDVWDIRKRDNMTKKANVTATRSDS